MTQPTNPLIKFASDNVNTPSTGLPNKKEPPILLQTLGYDKDQIVAGNHLNYILDNFSTYLQWMQDQITEQQGQITEQQDQITEQQDQLNASQIKVGGFYLGGDEDPAKHFKYGVWSKIAADITLRSSVTQRTTVQGDNNPLVPLKSHVHKVTLSENGNHSHTWPQPTVDTDEGDGALAGGDVGSPPTPPVTITTNKTGTHTHIATCEATGEESPTIDVRGRHLGIVMWQRVS